MPLPASIPRIRLHSPAIDFVENRLPSYHAAFNHPHANYDPALHKFVDDCPPGHGMQNTGIPKFDETYTPPPRPPPDQIPAMKFWHSILPAAMKRLKDIKEPTGRGQSGYSIREATKWEEINEKLDLARNVYEPCDKARLKRMMRKMADSSVVPLQQAAKLIPNTSIASPVGAAINLLLDVSNLSFQAHT